MTDETREARHARLLKQEADAFERASRNSETAGPAQREVFAREWFAASARLLKANMQLHAPPSQIGLPQPYPLEAIGRLANLAEALSVGCFPQPVVDVTANGGRPNRWPGARRDIATALDYIEHARSGAVSDKAFIKQVAGAFRVDRTTVRDWLNAGEEIRKGFPQVPADRFPQALKKAGARYRFNRTGKKIEVGD